MHDEAPATARSKTWWRERTAAARRARTADDLAVARAAVAGHVLDRCRTSGWRCVAAYVPMRTEPGSLDLLTALHGAGVRVLVPVTLPDRDLDWAQWQPEGEHDPLGVAAIAGADAVLVPASAVAADGTRLGRGGGSYDRALPRARPDVERIALLFDGELVDELPSEPWDAPVTGVVSPSGWTPLPR